MSSVQSRNERPQNLWWVLRCILLLRGVSAPRLAAAQGRVCAALDICVGTSTTYHGDSDLGRGHAHPVNKHALLTQILRLEIQATSRFLQPVWLKAFKVNRFQTS